MQVYVLLENGREGLLSNEHASSSYGQPVMVLDGIAYGPGDREVGEIVKNLTTHPEGVFTAEPILIEHWNNLVRQYREFVRRES